MNLSDSKHKILYATQDAGPAEYLSRIIKATSEPYACYSSLNSSRIFDKYGIKQFNKVDWDEITLLVTSLCGDGSLDNTLLKKAQERKIKTIAIIEHWTWLTERFKCGDEYLIPDVVFVNDALVKENLIKSNNVRAKIVVVGNPVLEENSVFEFKQNSDTSHHSICFISEVLSAHDCDAVDLFGFDEFTVLSDIIENLEGRELIIKLHPEESLDKYDSFLSEKNANVKVIKDCDLGYLVNEAGLIIGMESMLLLELAKYRNDIISYIPSKEKTFIGNQLGFSCLVDNKYDLCRYINNEKEASNKLVADTYKGSLERINNFIREFID